MPTGQFTGWNGVAPIIGNTGTFIGVSGELQQYGYGIGQYGHTWYGGASDEIPVPVVSTLLLSKYSGTAGNDILVASAIHNPVFIDPSINNQLTNITLDNFNIFGPGKLTDIYNQQYIEVLPSGGYLDISLPMSFRTGLFSVDYEPVHTSQSITDRICNAYFYITFDDDSYLDICRFTYPSGRQVVIATLMMDSVVKAIGSIDVTTTSGRFELGYCDGTYYAAHDGYQLINIRYDAIDQMYVGFGADSETNAVPLFTKFRNFVSQSGILIGNKIVPGIPSHGSVKMTIPQLNAGVKSMTVFNHNGMVGFGEDIFKYNEFIGRQLSPYGGINANIMSDMVLR